MPPEEEWKQRIEPPDCSVNGDVAVAAKVAATGIWACAFKSAVCKCKGLVSQTDGDKIKVHLIRNAAATYTEIGLIANLPVGYEFDSVDIDNSTVTDWTLVELFPIPARGK